MSRSEMWADDMIERVAVLEKTLKEVLAVAERSREEGNPAPIDALKHIIVLLRAAEPT